MSAEDILGNPVGAMSGLALSGVNDFVAGFLSYERRAANVMEAADADPEAMLANIYAGFS